MLDYEPDSSYDEYDYCDDCVDDCEYDYCDDRYYADEFDEDDEDYIDDDFSDDRGVLVADDKGYSTTLDEWVIEDLLSEGEHLGYDQDFE